MLKDLGEVEYDRKKIAETLAWIRTHPSRFRQLTLARVGEFWFPEGLTKTFSLSGFWLGTIFGVARPHPDGQAAGTGHANLCSSFRWSIR